MSRKNPQGEQQHPPLVRAAMEGNVDQVNELIAQGESVDLNYKIGEGNEAVTLTQFLLRNYPEGSSKKANAFNILLAMQENLQSPSPQATMSRSGSGKINYREQAGAQMIDGVEYNGLDILLLDVASGREVLTGYDEGEKYTVKKLLEMGANPNIADPYDKMTPLMMAIRNANFDAVDCLIEYGADITAKDDKDRTVMKHVQIAHAFYDTQIDRDIEMGVGQSDKDLHKTQLGNIEKIVNLVTANLLIEAAKYYSEEEFDKLIEKGANINAQDKNGMTVLHHAAEYDNGGFVAKLLENGADMQITDKQGRKPNDILPAGYSNFRVNASAYANQASNEQGLNHRKSYLMLAIEKQDVNEVKNLLECGARVQNGIFGRNGRLKEGASSPLHMAAQMGNAEIIQALIDKGADITARRGDGITPLALAVISGKEDAINKLKDATLEGEKIKKPEEINRTELMEAVLNGNNKYVDFLISENVDVNQKNENGLTALHYAVRNGKDDIAKKLIHNGADANITDNKNNTPLHFAALHSKFNCVELLVNMGANINAKNSEGKTPSDLEARLKYSKIFRAASDVDKENDPPQSTKATGVTHLATGRKFETNKKDNTTHAARALQEKNNNTNSMGSSISIC